METTATAEVCNIVSPDARKSREGARAVSDTVHIHQHRPMSPLHLSLLYAPLYIAQQGSHELVAVQVGAKRGRAR